MALTEKAVALFEAQHGVAARRQLVPLLGADPVDALLQRGAIAGVERGVYRLAGAAETPEMLAMAAAHRAGPHARLTGPFVLGQLHLDTFSRFDPFTILTAPSRRLRGVSFPHRPDPVPDRRPTPIGCLPTVHPLVALVDSLAALERRERRVALHVVRRAGHWSDQRFQAERAARGDEDAGVAALVEMLEDGVLESDTVQEVELGERLRKVDPAFEPQVWVSPRLRPDWFLRRLRLGVEYQGDVDHGDAVGRMRDSGREEMAASIGVLLVPVVAADLRDDGFDDWMRSVLASREFELGRASR